MDAIERLPDQAQTKYALVQMEAVDARDGAVHAAKMLKEVEYATAGTDPSAADKQRMSSLRERLKEAQQRDFVMRGLMSSLNLFIQRAANNSAISVSMFDKRSLPKRKRSGDAAEALDAIRAEIDSTKSQIAAIERAPLKGKSKRAAVKRYLSTLVANGKPTANVNAQGEVSIRLGSGPDSVALFDAKGSRLLGMVMHLVGEDKVLDLLAPQEQERPDAITPAERDERLTELRDQLLLLEREEESLIDSSGVMRRADADPRAILGVEAPRLKSLAAA